MNRKRTIFVLLAIAILGLAGAVTVPSRAQAGSIEAGLEERLAQTGEEGFLWVIIRPAGERIRGANLKAEVATRYRTRAERHTAAVTRLQAVADRTQPPLIDALLSDYYRDRVIDVESFWIDNVITARMTPSAIAEFADRPDVGEITLMPPIELVRPAAIPPSENPLFSPAAAQRLESGLIAIKADSVWAMGITGKGRLVASIDTGVDGVHSFLVDKWRGSNGYSLRESYYDPLRDDQIPKVLGEDQVAQLHGTQVMGIMVSASTIPALPDTFGVCVDCQWITAAAISTPCPGAPDGACAALGACCGNIMGAMQWVADPDGDPLTEHDVPDAVANPWGIPQWVFNGSTPIPTHIRCSDVLWDAIDNVEAAGAAMIFAAGNEGDQPFPTIRNPANRVESETNTFAVGMVDTRDLDNIKPDEFGFSSKGPSDCTNPTTDPLRLIKPEVVAPGNKVRTLRPNQAGDFGNVVGSAYGTSFATPFVAAGIALLREYNPNATVDEIRNAMLQSARDLGPTGPDNLYGHGLLDLMGALRLLPQNTEPHLSIKDDHYVHPAPGTTADLVLVLRSAGGIPASNITVNMFSEHARVTILDGSASFPDVTGDFDTTANHASPLQFSVAEDAIAGERYPVRFEITASGGYSRTVHAAVEVGPAQSTEIFTHDAGNFELTVYPGGMFGMVFGGFSPRPGGEGYTYGGDPTQSLFEGSFLVGINQNQVSDNARDVNVVPDADFVTDIGGMIEVHDPGDDHAEETRTAFSDAGAENPIGLFIEQRTWVDADDARDDYCVAEYTITNRSGVTAFGVRAGLFFDWDFPWVSSGTVFTADLDSGRYDPSSGVGWMNMEDSNLYRGLAVISPTGATSYRHFNNASELFDNDGFSERDKWNALSGGFTQTAPTEERDGAHLIATGPFTIPADSSVIVAFAIIGGYSPDDLIASAEQARADYNAGVFSVSPSALQFVATVGGSDPPTRQITLSNATDEDVDFAVGSIPNWLSVLPGNGTVDAVSDEKLDVTASIAGLGIGTYNGDIVITATDAQQQEDEFTVKATLVVQDEQVSEFPVDPNPFNPDEGSVQLSFELTAGVPYTATIYDIGGNEVKVLEPESPKVGTNTIEWEGKSEDGETVAEGVYICHISAAGLNEILKIVVKK